MPPLSRLYLKDFRNHGELRLDFESGRVVLLGANGRGKTNIIEAIHFLSVLRSFRTGNMRSLFRIGSSAFELQARLETPSGSVRLRLEQEFKKRRLAVDGEILKRSSDFIRNFRAVAFVPEDIETVGGASGGRRRFFDMFIAVADEKYRIALKDYLYALTSRNAALKSNATAAVIAAFDEVMAQSVPAVAAARRDFAGRLSSEMRTLLRLDEGDFNIAYRPDVSAEEFPERLASGLDSDRRRGFTSYGPQNDEFEFSYFGRPLRNYGSTGQLRRIALYLKLAELEILRRMRMDDCPVIALVDDVTGELDAANREAFFSVLGRADQQFFTFTSPATDAFFSGAQSIEI